mmetsp:Transcript_24193/g.42760  ORF Transcript_24193/g.42760 Transcript_24193/m.42760 type:complete len:251 (+) Transcript_24193:1-753(+)
MDLAAKGWSSSSQDSAGSGLSVGLKSPTFWTALVLNVIFLILMRWSTIYGCRRCDVLMFVPLNTTTNIILSVSSGMICLSEFQSVTSWPGLVTAGLSMLCGIFMLVTGPAETMVGGSISPSAWTETELGKNSPPASPPVSRRPSAERSPQRPLSPSATSPISPGSQQRLPRQPSASNLSSRTSVLGFVYMNRIHRRAARKRSEIGSLAESLSDRRDSRDSREGLAIGLSAGSGLAPAAEGTGGSASSHAP